MLGVEDAAAISALGMVLSLTSRITFAAGLVNADEIGGANAVLESHGANLVINAESGVVGLIAHLVFHAAEAFLLTDAHRVLLLPQVSVVVGVGVVEGGKAAGDTGVVLKAALRSSVAVAVKLGHLDLPLPDGIVDFTVEGELKSGRVGIAPAEVDVHVLSSVLSANGGDVLSGVDLHLEGISAKTSILFQSVGGTGDVEVLKVQSQVADVVAALVDGVSDGVLVIVVGVGEVLITNVGAILIDFIAGLLDGENTADAETDGASASGSSSPITTLGLGVASAVTVGVAGSRTAQG